VIERRKLSDGERRAWLRLARSPNVGGATFAALLARFGSAGAALKELPRLIRRGGGDERPIPTDADAEREMTQLAKLGGRFIASIEPEFPAGLAAVDATPPIISVLGNSELLAREMIAIVGARNASALGRKFAGALASELTEASLVVVSGMARGIDTAAHEGALAGGTCAVVAGGIDYVYPPENAKLYDRLRAEGVIVSEMAVGLVPQARHFPRRNRIISGLSRGVVVVEAAEGSGSLITANYALEQSREVFAVPGSPLDPRAKGTNRLIREGATLTESAADVMAVLSPIIGRGFREPEHEPLGLECNDASEGGNERIRKAVEEALGPAPVAIDELVRQTGAPAAVVLSVLLELELAGRVARHPGNLVSWV
jgi:DNA processing protein